MKNRGILFSAPMVRAILDGTKTQTRRVVNVPRMEKIGPASSDTPEDFGFYAEGKRFSGWMVLARGIKSRGATNNDDASIPCPYGEPGDRLWGRETWGMHFGKLLYRADFGPQSYEYDAKGWKSSIHMPRALSRLLFDLQGVRCERVQGITEADAQTEGVECGLSWSRVYPGTGAARIRESFREAFARLWNEINGKRGLGWAHNPWVWALSIQQVSA